jgi:hypothetical protein
MESITYPPSNKAVAPPAGAQGWRLRLTHLAGGDLVNGLLTGASTLPGVRGLHFLPRAIALVAFYAWTLGSAMAAPEGPESAARLVCGPAVRAEIRRLAHETEKTWSTFDAGGRSWAGPNNRCFTWPVEPSTHVEVLNSLIKQGLPWVWDDESETLFTGLGGNAPFARVVPAGTVLQGRFCDILSGAIRAAYGDGIAGTACSAGEVTGSAEGRKFRGFSRMHIAVGGPIPIWQVVAQAIRVYHLRVTTSCIRVADAEGRFVFKCRADEYDRPDAQSQP